MPTINVVKSENPLAVPLLSLTIMVNEVSAISKNMPIENSRNVIIDKMYPVILKIHIVKEKDAYDNICKGDFDSDMSRALFMIDMELNETLITPGKAPILSSFPTLSLIL